MPLESDQLDCIWLKGGEPILTPSQFSFGPAYIPFSCQPKEDPVCGALFTGPVVYWTRFIFGLSLTISVPGQECLRFSSDGGGERSLEKQNEVSV